MSWSDTLQVVVAVATGGGLTVGADILLDARREKRDAANHRRDRFESFEDRRIEFELETLTKLHTAVSVYLRSVAQVHLEDLQMARSTGRQYAATSNGNDELSEELRRNGVDVQFLSGLVLDDDLRAQVERVKQQTFDLSYGEKSIADAEGIFLAMVTAGADLLARISARIRELYAAGLHG